MRTTLQELASLVDGRLGDPTQGRRQVTGFADLLSAGDEDVSFFGNSRYLAQLKQTHACVVLVPDAIEVDLEPARVLRVANPSVAFAKIVQAFAPPSSPAVVGVHPAAVIDPTADFNPASVSIAAGAFIGARVTIGDETQIGPNVVIYEGVSIGKACKIYANVTIREHCLLGDRVTLQPGSVVGSDGFGYEYVEGRHQKIEQVGIVELGDDVEVGANTTIDRARFGRTRIGEGTKIDNLVQIGHNVEIGKHSIVVAQTGLAGSCHIGNGVVIAAQSGVAGHLSIGDGSILASRSGVTKNLAGGQTYMGYPAQPAAKARKEIVFLRRMGEIIERLKAVEKRMPPPNA